MILDHGNGWNIHSNLTAPPWVRQAWKKCGEDLHITIELTSRQHNHASFDTFQVERHLVPGITPVLGVPHITVA
jgi:hypothetical protein